MKSNILKTVIRPDSVLFKYEKDYRVTKPYYPSKQIILKKKEDKPNSLGSLFFSH
ncbi:MAG: hypothetical protein AB1782_17820 [Cyanobacteriota bacterium]